MSLRVSIHICTRDRFKELYGLLTSLYGQTYQNWDLILIDESTQPIVTDKCVRDVITRLKCDGHGVKIIKHNGSQLQGISHARNVAIENDHWNEVFIRIDDDSVCHPDYVKLLVETYAHLKSKGIPVGAVGGTVPLFGEPEVVRSIQQVTPVFNKITYKDEKFNVGDDGGVSYTNDLEVIQSDHLRSSFLFSREAAYAAGLHSEELGSPNSGFREETDFCMKIKLAGFKLFTIPGAKAWHLQAQSGGTRNAGSAQVYNESVANNEFYFQRKWNRKKRQGKLPNGFVEGI